MPTPSDGPTPAPTIPLPGRWCRGPLVGVLGALLCLPATVQAQLPGRLFTTPEQRAYLEELRSRAPAPAAPVAAAPEPGVPQPPRPPVRLDAFTMDGLVIRADGPNTAWVDRRAVLHSGTTEQGVVIDTERLDAGGVRIELPDRGGSLHLRVGEGFQPGER